MPMGLGRDPIGQMDPENMLSPHPFEEAVKLEKLETPSNTPRC